MLKNLVTINCENCGTLMAAIVECDDGIKTYEKCDTCGHYHDVGSDFANAIDCELQNLADIQAENKTQLYN